MESNLYGESISDVLTHIFESTQANIIVVDPTTAVLEALVELLNTYSTNVQFLGSEPSLKSALDEFRLASRAADHVDSGELELFPTAIAANTVLITVNTITSLVWSQKGVAGLQTADQSVVRSVRSKYTTALESSDSLSLRAPPYSTVLQTMSELIEASAADEFDTMLTSLKTHSDVAEKVDEVMVALLVAARHEIMLYDLSKWGEDIGIASKATFSRTKSRLENAGIISTEKVPIDVGRPRLKLELVQTNRLPGLSAESLVIEAARMLET